MTPVLLHLYAMRAHLEALIVALETEAKEMDTPPPSGTCSHPADRQRKAGTFSDPSNVICLDCGVNHPGDAPE